MSAYLMSLFTDDEPTTYGWIITKDVFAESNGEEPEHLGTAGPRQAPDEITAELQRRLEGKPARDGFQSAVFDMYVDVDSSDQKRGERMARGRLVWTSEGDPDEDALMSPLEDFGAPNWGCVRIEYLKHPKWTIG